MPPRRRYATYTFEDARRELEPCAPPAPRRVDPDQSFYPDDIIRYIVALLEAEHARDPTFHASFRSPCWAGWQVVQYRQVGRQWSRIIGERVHQLWAPKLPPPLPLQASLPSMVHSFPRVRMITLPAIKDGQYAQALSNLIGTYRRDNRVFVVRCQHYHAGDGTVPVNVHGAYASNGTILSRFASCMCVYRGTPTTNSCNSDWPECSMNIAPDGNMCVDIVCSAVSLNALGRVLSHDVLVYAGSLSSAQCYGFAPGQFRAKGLVIELYTIDHSALLAQIMRPENWHDGQLPDLIIKVHKLTHWTENDKRSLLARFPTATFLHAPS